MLYLTVSIGLDPVTLRWFHKIKEMYNTEIDDEDAKDLDDSEPIAFSNKTAVKFAIQAQSKVGCLKPSVANRLVYETTLLHLFDELHVRRNIRMALLGEALIACFIRPESYKRALDVIEVLSSDETTLGVSQ
jgi:hypothetical protein